MDYHITIIIPIYNVEKYLTECIQSVINQKMFDRLKVLLVDDGSTDKSSSIAKKFAKRHKNLEYIYKENGGQSSARNLALQLVQTPYIMFLDSDDILPENACFSLYSYAKETGCPIVIGDLETFPDETPKYLWKKYFGNGNLVVNDIYDFPDLIFGPSPCNRIFNIEYLRSKNFKFPEGLTFEDAYAIIPLMLDNSPIGILDEVVYHYRKRDEGTSTMDNIYTKPKNYFDHLLVNEKLYNLIPEKALHEQKETIYKYIIRTYNGFLSAMVGQQRDVLTKEEKIEIFTRLQKLYKHIPLHLFTKYISNPSLKLIYFSILENKMDLFLTPWVFTNEVIIDENITYLPVNRELTGREFIASNISIWMDFSTVENNTFALYGTINSVNLAFIEPLKNKISFYLENPSNGKRILEYPAEVFKRKPHPNAPSEATYHGVKLNIPFEDFPLLKHRYYRLMYSVQDVTTKQTISRKVIASGLLNRFRGSIKAHNNETIGLLNIYDKKSIFLRNDITKKRQLEIQFKKIFNVNKKRLRVGGKLRLLYWLTYPFFAKREITLIGERRDTFQDNSAHLFKYVRENHPRAKWYYLLDEKAPKYQEVKKLGNVIRFDSFKHYLYLLHAKKLINSYDLESYMIPKGYSKDEYLNKFGDLINYRRIFLQHGIVYNDITFAASRFKTAYDLIVSSNTKEEQFFINNAFFNKENIIQSGLPRYDRLRNYIRLNKRENKDEIKQILLMPTWRSTLAKKSYVKKSKQKGAGDKKFMESDYYQFYEGVLSDSSIHEYLKENNAVLNFYPHYEMRDFIHLFNSESEFVRIIDTDADVQDLLIKSDVLITDYSSVFFDFAFMNKPIIFTQFDFEDFYKTQYKEGYFKFTEQNIGPVVKKTPDLLIALQEVSENGYVMTDSQTNYAKQFFDFYDGSSINEKIYRKIEGLRH